MKPLGGDEISGILVLLHSIQKRVLQLNPQIFHTQSSFQMVFVSSWNKSQECACQNRFPAPAK